jgi:small subunit ribosomal protein S16
MCRWPGGHVACLNIGRTQVPAVFNIGTASPPTGFEHIMVVIRLSRGGAKARPFFNIVVADKRVRRDGRFIERIGFYNPTATGAAEGLRIAQDRLNHWLSVGAQPSPTVQRLVKQAAKAAPATA